MRRFAFVEVPIPPPEQYRSVLRRKAEAATSGEQEVFRRETLALLERLFTPEEGEGLAALGLLVGPAIPLDILRYAERRAAHSAEVGAREVVLEGVEMYLFPQFEGKQERHSEILNSISSALSLDEAGAKCTGRVLATWTGFEEPTA